MNKYDRLKESLDTTGTGKMKCGGNSMKPILPNPSVCVYQKQDTYEVGDIVFCKVRGRWIDAHIITKKDNNRYMIANNHGFENGWTTTIFGKVIMAYDKNEKVVYGNK